MMDSKPKIPSIAGRVTAGQPGALSTVANPKRTRLK